MGLFMAVYIPRVPPAHHHRPRRYQYHEHQHISTHPSVPHLTAQVEGNGFLYKMVRHISGALVAVGEGRLSVNAVARMLEVGSNAPPGCYGSYRGYNVAPAKGLCLHHVLYESRVDDPSVLLYPDLQHDEYGRLLESIPDARSDE
ncbi:hypothetical protein Vafri_16701 [Volvox africanus]|uniref:tRNA pseudouridine synthase n=1 Tax=Volvox africanus TaxID=51714 RepID=A0A8J4F9Z6_9CHLO|nr:hypothetical protein Vafri_16701 [Volvox africanus]